MKNNVYIETTIWNLDAPKVTFEWVEENGERFGRLVAHNEEKHTYTEINLDPETVAKLGMAMLASAGSSPGRRARRTTSGSRASGRPAGKRSSPRPKSGTR